MLVGPGLAAPRRGDSATSFCSCPSGGAPGGTTGPAAPLVNVLALLLAALVAAAPCAAQTDAPTTGAPSTSVPSPAGEGLPASVPAGAADIQPRPDLGPTGPSRSTAVVREGPAVEAAPQPERLNAAVATLIEGLWELDEVSELPPASAELVFARLHFDGDDRMTTTTVYLDRDDGDLAGRSRRDRYFVADGQILARDGLRTRLLDVQPDSLNPDQITLRDIEERITMRLRRVTAAVERDPSLYATWSVAPPDHDEAITLTFRPDGRAVGTWDGDDYDEGYVVAGAYVILRNRDAFRYTVSNRHLVLESGDRLILLSQQAP